MKKFFLCLRLLLFVLVFTGIGLITGLLFPTFNIPLILGGSFVVLTIIACVVFVCTKFNKHIAVTSHIVAAFSGFSEGLTVSALFLTEEAHPESGEVLASYFGAAALILFLYIAFALLASLAFFGKHPVIYTCSFLGILLTSSILTWIFAGTLSSFYVFLALNFASMLLPLLAQHESDKKMQESAAISTAMVSLIALVIVLLVLADDADIGDIGLAEILDFDFESPIQRKNTKTDLPQ